MLVLNPSIITKTGGLYDLEADQNLRELKAIMKDIIVNEPERTRPAIWADSTTTVKDAATQTGGRIWAKTGVYKAFRPHKKREPRVKTFAL